MNTDTNTEFLGTCPACFNKHVVRKGVMVKHGWQEIGGREVGVYGKAFHVGPCHASNLYQPYEVSCSGTQQFLKLVLPHLPACRDRVAILQTRPVLLVDVTEYVKDSHGGIVYKNRRAVTKTTTHECSETNDFGTEVINGSTRYERELARSIAIAESNLRSVEAQIAFLEEKIATWAPAEMPEYHGKTIVRHYKRDGAKAAACGSRSYGLLTSTESDVTCTRCLKALATAAAEKAARDAVAADRDAFIAFVKAAGKPVSGKEVRTALGWDIKRWNKASDRSYNYGIESTYEKNTEFFTMK